MKKRLFIGVELPKKIKKEIKEFVDSNFEMPIFWRDPEGFHLTILFIGNIRSSKISEIINISEDACLECQDFNIRLKGVRQLKRGDKRILCIDVDYPKKLITIFEKLKISLDIYVDNRKNLFNPHIVIGKVKKGENVNSVFSQFKDKDFGKFKVEKISLFESVQKNKTNIYRILQRFFLR